MDTLATEADLSERDVTDGDLYMALAVASSLIRDAAGCSISEETSTVTVTGSRSKLLSLPGPVTAVSSVAIGTSAVTDYMTLPNGLYRACGWADLCDIAQVTVTYTHGLATVPDDIVDLTCNLAKAWLDHAAAGGGSTAGLNQVAIDDAREGYTDEAAGQISPVYIPQATRDWLGRRFGGSVAVVETL